MRQRVILLDRRSLPRPGTRATACLWSMRRPRRLRWLVSCRTGLGGNQLNRLVGQRTASLNDISEDSIRRGRVQMSAFRLGTVEGRSLAGHTLHVTDLLSQTRIIRLMRKAMFLSTLGLVTRMPGTCVAQRVHATGQLGGRHLMLRTSSPVCIRSLVLLASCWSRTPAQPAGRS